jgi:hypothetical protein
LVGDGLLAIPDCSQRGEWNDSGRGRWRDWSSTATVRDVEDKLGANNIATAASQPDQEAAVPRRRLVISTFQRWFRIALRANSTLVKHIPSHYSTMNLYPSRPLGPSRALRVRGHTHAPLRVRAPSCAFDFERRKRSLGGFFSKRARERSVESVLFFWRAFAGAFERLFTVLVPLRALSYVRLWAYWRRNTWKSGCQTGNYL